MHLRELHLINFKNYSEEDFIFDAGANCFVGNNGEGKTNLLDAIHYLSFCKSYFNAIDSQHIKNGTEFFVVQGIFQAAESEENIYCGLKKNQRKIFKRNHKEYERLAHHIGLLPVVIIAPTDTALITEGSDERRKFIDSIISQYDKNYLDDLINYNKIIAQRNAMLKQLAVSRSFDQTSFDVWDEQMIPLAEKIYSSRSDFMNKFIPGFRQHYEFISGGKEKVDIQYESHLHKNNFGETLRAAQNKDRTAQFTTVGTHKDDLVFVINDQPVKRFASQGQQKSYLTALKLAQFDFIREVKKLKPILLLDDIFDKLDEQRITRLMELVSKENFGQIFITDTHPERVQNIFATLEIPLNVFLVKDGNAKQEKSAMSSSRLEVTQE